MCHDLIFYNREDIYMDQINFEQLPEVSIYAIGPEEAEYVAPLLTPEAVTLIQNGQIIEQ